MMAYNDDAVLARLSALNESHDSIATAAQWIMFHKYEAAFFSTVFNILTYPPVQAARRPDCPDMASETEGIPQHSTAESHLSCEW